MYDIYVRLDTLDANDTEDKVLWAPGLEDNGYILYSAILELQVNHSGKLTFQMSPKHPLYGLILKRKTRVIVRRNGVEYWRGRVLDSKKDFYKRQTVVCEGALSYLLDTTVRPYSFNGTFQGYMEYALGVHNADCDDDKKIYLGRIAAVDPTIEVSISNLAPSEYPSTLDELNDKTVNQYGGYLKVRRDDEGLLRLDYLGSTGEQIDQQIRFGKNLLDLEDYITAENVCTRCIPLGATQQEISDFNSFVNSSTSSTLDEDTANKRLDITSVTEGNVDYIEHAEGKALFGKITRCIVFENIVTAQSLHDTALEWLNNNVSMNVSMSIKAIDLSLLMRDIEAIDCGISAEVISPPHEIDTFMLCSAMKLNILSPGQTDYTFGAGFNSMTDQQAKALKQSSKAFDTAKNASTSARNITTTIVGQYVTATEFNNFKDELNDTLDDINDIPEATDLDNGKVLKIVGGKWVKANDEIGEPELPEITSEDDGKVLKVVDGQWAKADNNVGEAELPEITEEDDGKVLKVVGGQWVKADDNVGEIELPAVTEEHEGMILKVVGGKWTAVAVE